MTMNTGIQHQVRATYARRSRRYDTILRGLTLGLQARLRDRLVDRLALRPGEAVLGPGLRHGSQLCPY